jgi:DamX protein
VTPQELPLLASQTQLRLRLSHLLAIPAPFIFLSGSTGSGRTLMCEQLLSMFETPWRVAYLSCQSTQTLARLRETLITQLVPLSVFDPEDNCADTLFRLLGVESSHLLLVVDDADLAPDELVSELWDLYSINAALPHPHKISVLLCGQASWCERHARRLDGHIGPALELEIEPLPMDEQMALLEYCLLRAGYYALLPNPAALADKLRLCAGNPGQIVALAESIMTKKSVLKRPDLPTNKVIATLGVVAALVLLLSWAIPSLLNQGKESPPGSDPKAANAAVSAAPDTVIPAQKSIQVVEDKTQLPGDAVGNLDLNEQAPADKRRVVIADTVVKEIMANQKADKPVSAAHEATSGAVPTAVSGAVTSLAQMQPLVDEFTGGKQSVTSAAAATTPTASTDSPPKEPSHKTSKPAAKAPAAKATAALGSNNELKKKPLRSYTVQLSASGEVAPLLRYAKQNKLAGRYWIYQTEFQAKPWYVLIQGEYTSAKQAKAAINGMPAALKQSQPWPKSFGQVQKEMK